MPLVKPKQTEAPERKPVPVTVIEGCVNAWALVGVIEVMVGSGLGAVIVNARELEGPPPGEGFETVTCAVPGVARAEDGSVARKSL